MDILQILIALLVISELLPFLKYLHPVFKNVRSILTLIFVIFQIIYRFIIGDTQEIIQNRENERLALQVETAIERLLYKYGFIAETHDTENPYPPTHHLPQRFPQPNPQPIPVPQPPIPAPQPPRPALQHLQSQRSFQLTHPLPLPHIGPTSVPQQSLQSVDNGAGSGIFVKPI